MVREVVLAVTLKVAGLAASTFMVAGTGQEAPLGAPVQVSAAVPLIPAPPMESIYDAADPAATVAVLEPVCRTRQISPSKGNRHLSA